jgi:hypothetical protein
VITSPVITCAAAVGTQDGDRFSALLAVLRRKKMLKSVKERKNASDQGRIVFATPLVSVAMTDGTSVRPIASRPPRPSN